MILVVIRMKILVTTILLYYDKTYHHFRPSISCENKTLSTSQCMNFWTADSGGWRGGRLWRQQPRVPLRLNILFSFLIWMLTCLFSWFENRSWHHEQYLRSSFEPPYLPKVLNFISPKNYPQGELSKHKIRWWVREGGGGTVGSQILSSGKATVSTALALATRILPHIALCLVCATWD